jgi:hypothetical protein
MSEMPRKLTHGKGIGMPIWARTAAIMADLKSVVATSLGLGGSRAA